LASQDGLPWVERCGWVERFAVFLPRDHLLTPSGSWQTWTAAAVRS